MDKRLKVKTETPESIVRRRMQVVLSIVLVSAALCMLFSRTDAEAQKWAYGIIGLILGFWLKP